MPTIIEVARLAGVSKSTASRVLTGDSKVSEESKAKVLAAAQALGYSVNRMASALRSGRSKLIGLVVTNLVNASVLKIIEIVEARAQVEGYVVLLGVTDGDAQREAAVVNALTHHGIDGLIIMQSGRNSDQINRLFESGLPVVDLIRLPGDSTPPAVLADNFNGAYLATQHLVEMGHSAIAYVGGPAAVISGAERFEGYRQALGDCGLQPSHALVRCGGFLPRFGVDAMHDLLRDRDSFSAVVVANHEALFGVLPVLIQEGVDVPGSLSLVGFEDVNWFQTWHPPLTVIDVDPTAMADAAFDLLFRQMTKRTAEGLDLVTRKPARLILRRSTSRLG